MSASTSASTSPPPVVPLLSAGRWEASRAERAGDVFNPSTGALIARVPFCDAAEVDRVVRSAHAAAPGWAAHL